MFCLILAGKRYLVPSRGIFRLEPTSLHTCLMQAVIWTQTRTVEGAEAKCRRSFFCLQEYVWWSASYRQGYHVSGQHQSNMSLSVCS